MLVPRIVAVLSLCLLLSTGAAASPRFGNLIISPGEGVARLSAGTTVLVGDRSVTELTDGGLYVWELRTGTVPIEVTIGNQVLADTVAILPNLTTKLVVVSTGDGYRLEPQGYADQTGSLLTFSREDIVHMPGEMADGVGLFATGGFSPSRTSWDGLSFRSASSGSWYTFSNRIAPAMAWVNLGDPFAGSGAGEVDLLQRPDGQFEASAEGLWATRDQRLHRGMANLPVLDGRARLFGAITYENTEDAFPRWNMEHRLPHNGVDDIEALGNAQVKITQKLAAEGQFLYKSVDRNIYDHAYYFNIEHAPREESRLYRGQASVYGWLNSDLFLQAGFGLRGDKGTFGDSKYFDDLVAYGRPEGNPRFDGENLFWSWDREPEYDNEGNCISGCADEAHVFDEFIRVQAAGWEANVSVSKSIFEGTRATLYGQYQADTYRKYRHYFPTVILRDGNEWEPYAFIDAEMIGFDTLAQETTDEAAFGSLPSPKQMAIGLSAERIREDHFVRGSIEYWRYDPGYLALRNRSNPFDPDGFRSDGDPSNDSLGNLLDEADLRETVAQNLMNVRLGAGTTLRLKYHLFAHFALTHEPQPYASQCSDLDFVEYKVTSGGYYTPLGNPELKAIARKQFGIGTRLDMKNYELVAQFTREQIENTAAVWTVPALPRSYSQYQEDIDVLSNKYMLQVQRSGEYPLTGAFVVSYSTFNTLGTDLPSNIAWTVSNSPMQDEFDLSEYSLSGHICFRPGKLLSLSSTATGKILKRMAFDFLGHYRSGVLYSPKQVYSEVMLTSTSPVPSGLESSERAKSFLELNAAVTASIVDLPRASLALRCEVLNLLDTENWLNVYESSGEPDNTGWLNTGEGREFIDSNDVPDDTGLNGEQKYRLKENNPTNFGRPRTVRVLAQFSF